MQLSRVKSLWRSFRATVARQGVLAIPSIVGNFALSTRLGSRLAMRRLSGRLVKAGKTPLYAQTFNVELPQAYPSRKVEVRISVPAIPLWPRLEFAEHIVDAQGRATEAVLASTLSGFAVSRDLGESWAYVAVRGLGGKDVVHAKALGDGEYLLQTATRGPDRSRPREIDLLVVDETGKVLASNRLTASPWHGCRSVDMAGGVLMFAEYPYEVPNPAPEQRDTSRVWRSRDRGRSWQIVFEVRDIRHLHFLQARPGRASEWWLTSGDAPLESRIWVSKDDGESWHDTTAAHGKTLRIGETQYPKSVFRLTDLAWQDDDVVWGTDDFLGSVKGDVPGSRVFRSPCAETLVPQVVGRSRWQIRNMVDAGDYFFILTQGCVRPNATMEEKKPGVFLMSKAGREPQVAHLFDVEIHTRIRTGFTYSSASRTAKDGTFFTFRGSTDAFPKGHRFLRWDVRFG